MSRVKRLKPRTDKPPPGFQTRQSGETATEEPIHRIFCLIGSVTMLPVSETQRRERLYTPLGRLDRAAEGGTHLRQVPLVPPPRPRPQTLCRILKRTQCCDERKPTFFSFFLSLLINLSCQTKRLLPPLLASYQRFGTVETKLQGDCSHC